jgi:dolichol-phosphate mannosyltransferase
MIGFSNKPLRMTLCFGVGIVCLSLLMVLYYLFDFLINGTDVSGFTTLVISVWLVAGILTSILGMLGLYLGKVFDQVKQRPTYIIMEKLNFD